MNVKRKKTAVSPAMCFAGLAVLFLLVLSVRKDLQVSEISFGDVIKQNMAQEFGERLIRKFVPVFSFVQQGEQDKNWLLEEQITGIMPLYGYSTKTQKEDFSKTEQYKTEQENYLLLEELQQQDIQELLMAENEAALQANEETNKEITKEEPVQETAENATENIAENVAEEALQPPSFVRHEIQNPVDLQALSNYETLVKNFYTIDNNTMAGSDQLEVSKLTGKDLKISKEGEGPQILIYHTHSQEAFADSVPGDVGTGIVGVGQRLCDILTNEYGYKVLHHTGQYDVETRDDAYSKSLPDIERVLAENPSIEVIIDLHRDSMPEETKLVMDLDGRPTARFMFFNGLSRTQKTGDIAYLRNDNLDDNLAFSFQLQLKATEYYPGLTRKIYLKGYRYNMHLRPRTTLIELGAQNNTVEEAMNACDPLAHILDMVLSGEM